MRLCFHFSESLFVLYVSFFCNLVQKWEFCLLSQLEMKFNSWFIRSCLRLECAMESSASKKKKRLCCSLLRPMNSSMRSKKALTMNWWKNRGRHNLDFYIPILFSPCRSQFSLAAQCVCCLIGGRGSMSVSSAKLFSPSFNLASRESSLRSSRDMCKFCWCRPFVIKQAQFHYEFRFNPVLRFSSSAHFSSFERVFDSMMMLCNFMLDQVSSTPNYCVCLLQMEKHEKKNEIRNLSSPLTLFLPYLATLKFISLLW